ncbi:MAG: PP2C family protein-serine/threonine phosphatase [Verrucomicrobiales bacterium]
MTKEAPHIWHPLSTVTSVILVAVCVALVVVILRVRRHLQKARQEREAIEGEEYRMFDFLHGLGEKVFGAGSARLMHREVVNGVSKVVGAKGGILYMHDVARGQLVPVFATSKCPALLPLPPEILTALEINPKALRGHQQLQALPLDQGPAAEALRDHKAVSIPAFAGLLPGKKNMKSPELVPAMLAPLYRGDEPLGVLVVARKPGAQPFSANDFTVFQSAAEQSGFAMVSAMTHKEATEKRKLESELKTASEIQRILLPEKDPDVEGWKVRGANRPARYVSGDYFDYIPVDSERTGIVIADVSGKGVAASLLTAMCRSVLRVAAAGSLSPSAALARLNRILYPDVREDMFISLAYILLHHAHGEVVLSRAGHDAPLLYRAKTGEVERIKCPGLALGIDEGPVFERVTRDHVFEMFPGDVLLLFTDGVNEAMDENGDEFGMDRLTALVRDHAREGASSVMEAVTSAVAVFAGDQPQSDDITLIVVEKC